MAQNQFNWAEYRLLMKFNYFICMFMPSGGQIQNYKLPHTVNNKTLIEINIDKTYMLFAHTSYQASDVTWPMYFRKPRSP